jgi:hypothetical protein
VWRGRGCSRGGGAEFFQPKEAEAGGEEEAEAGGEEEAEAGGEDEEPALTVPEKGEARRGRLQLW